MVNFTMVGHKPSKFGKYCYKGTSNYMVNKKGIQRLQCKAMTQDNKGQNTYQMAVFQQYKGHFGTYAEFVILLSLQCECVLVHKAIMYAEEAKHWLSRYVAL